MVSSPSPRPLLPSQSALLNASNLELLATPHEKNRVQEFVASQSKYARAQANEGRAVHASWDISTPEKNKMRLHQPSAGFETPVLRPRATQIEAEPEHRPPSSPHSKSSTDRPTTQPPKTLKPMPAVREAVLPGRQKKQGKIATAKNSGISNQARKKRHARSDTDEEHLARLTERRERKRAKREIMNAREVKTSGGDKENTKLNDRYGSNDKKKKKIPAGLALMHGFASTSVGKSRLTIEPPPNFGVFNKGKASTNIKVDASKRTKQYDFPARIFSEDRFLNSKPAKSPAQCLVSETSLGSNINHGPSSPIDTKRPAALSPRETPIRIRESTGRRQSATSTRRDIEMGNCDTSRVVDGQGAKSTNQTKPKKSRSPRSESWVIEQDGFSLPSTTSDVAIASVRSKPGTALLDIRAASWSRVLQNDLLDEKVLVPLEDYKHNQAISTLSAAAIVQGDASHTHLELEEQATIGPWESASQIAQSTLHPQEQRPAYSKYFSLPRGSESRFIQPIMHLSNSSLGQPADVNSGRSNGGEDAAIDERLFYKEVGVGHEGEDLLPTSPIANISRVRKASPLPEEGASVIQTSSLDSVDRALILDIPVVTRSRPRRRRRTMRWHKFNITPENMIFHQYGLDPPEDHIQVLRPSLNDHSDREPPDLGDSLGDPADLGNMQDNTLSFRGGGYAEGLEGRSEDQPGCSEHYPVILSDSPEFASQVEPTPSNGSYDCQDGAMFLIGEDTRYERTLETEEDCTDFNSDPISSADWRVLPEGDTDRKASIHLWDDQAWPRGDAVGGEALQEVCSHLTTVQKVEQDVARKLKGHWFPHKF